MIGNLRVPKSWQALNSPQMIKHCCLLQGLWPFYHHTCHADRWTKRESQSTEIQAARAAGHCCSLLGFCMLFIYSWPHRACCIRCTAQTKFLASEILECILEIKIQLTEQGCRGSTGTGVVFENHSFRISLLLPLFRSHGFSSMHQPAAHTTASEE